MKEPPEDIDRRRLVWAVLSDLFLDTEIDDSWLHYIARTLAESGYPDDELEGILYREVFPICIPNMKHPAGEWAGFNLEWLQERVLAYVTNFREESPAIPADYWMIEPEWRRVLELLPEARHWLRTTPPMLPLSISPDLKAKVPNVVFGWIAATIRNSQHNAALWQEIETIAARFRGMAMDEAHKFEPIKALRDAYRVLGNDPTRYRGSNEALVRRISQAKDLYRVNTVVDINNLISLETLHSAGTFDLHRVRQPIIFRIGQPGEFYFGIGRGRIKIEGLPVLADQLGPFGSTTSDSERTMVRLDTTRTLMVVISFLGAGELDSVLERAVGLLKEHAAASEIEAGVVA